MDIKTSKHIIAYVDILGYRNMISQFHAEDEFLNHIDTALTNTFKLCGIEKTDCKLKYNIFSDNIIFAIDVENCNEMEEQKRLNYLLNYMARFQSFLIIHYMTFIRGSITVGALYMDNNIGYVFGSGLITAYSLENNTAIYPRIIIDEPVLKLIKEPKLNYYIMLDLDKKYFLDYLSCLSYLLLNRQWDEQYSQILIREIYAHREAILQAIKVFDDDKLLPKYKWVARYHNVFCGKNHIEKLEKLWIEKAEFDWTY